MNARIGMVLFCGFTPLSCTIATPENQRPINEVKYAVAYCLSRSYPESEFSKDAEYVSGAYLQKGAYGIGMYEEIRTFVDAYRKEPLLSKYNKNLNIMQCVDLYDSAPLKEVIRKASRN